MTAGTGALIQITGSPFGAGTSPLFALFDPSGTFLYVGNEKSKNISGYTFDSTTGKLTAISGSPFSTPAEPGAMVIAH